MTSNSQHPRTTPPQHALGGCHWIDWEKAERFPDPTRCFSLLVIIIMIYRYAEAHDWDWTLTLYHGIVADVFVLVCVGTALISWLACYPFTKKLAVYDRWSAEWYWWNAWFFHMLMDGMVGSLRLIPLAVHQYDVLDRRFIQRHSVPWTVGMVELCIMNPLCLLSYWAVCQDHSLRFPLELITSTFQIMGMLIFLISEVYEGQLNVPALDPVGVPGNRWGNVKWNHYHLTYYWFGLWFCNLVWAVVPCYRIQRALAECQSAIQYKNQSEQQQPQQRHESNGKRDHESNGKRD
jgi:hypothetical protein